MRIRFYPSWVDQPNIDNAAASKKLEELQAEFFNWLYDCPQGFSSKLLPEQSPVALFKSFMAADPAPTKYYDQVLNLVEKGTESSLADLYGLTSSAELRWVFSQRNDMIVATLSEAKPHHSHVSFSIQDDKAAKKTFCAELFKYVRTKTRVVDDSFSTSTQFAAHEVLTQLYACHLSHKVT